MGYSKGIKTIQARHVYRCDRHGCNRVVSIMGDDRSRDPRPGDPLGTRDHDGPAGWVEFRGTHLDTCYGLFDHMRPRTQPGETTYLCDCCASGLELFICHGAHVVGGTSDG